MTAYVHVERFNDAVTSGDWSIFLTGFAPDAVMTFVGPPVGPFRGLAEITAGYAAQPPDDTMSIIEVRTEAGTDVVRFRWSRGGTGTMTIRWRDALIEDLVIAFD
jgi:steroid Delta-isomerase